MSSSTNQTISLVYPLSVDFAKRSEIEEDVIARSSNNSDTTTVQHNTQVQLDVLEIDYIRPEHLNYETRYIKSRDVIVRRKAIAFPWSYQLYVLIRTETNETRNVSFVRRLLLKHLHSRRCIDRTSRDKNAHGPFQSVAVDLSFTLVLTDIASSITSFYDFATLIKPRYRYESSALLQTEDLDSGFRQNNNLYAITFGRRRDYQDCLQFLLLNERSWPDVYAIPVSQDDDCLRFSFDMFLKNRRIEAERLAYIRHQELTSDLVGGGELEVPVITDDASINRAEQTVMQLFSEATSAPSTSSPDASVQETTAEEDKVDIFSIFSTGHWCVYKQDQQLLVIVDKEKFVKLFGSLHEDLLQATGATHPADLPWLDHLYGNPLGFIPNMVWDIETIARDPCSIPRGVRADEEIVSIAVVLDRQCIESRRLALVWVLVPASISDAEMRAIEGATLMEDNVGGIRRVVTMPYRHEKAMLYDFCHSMILNVPVLLTYLNIKSDCAHHYTDLTTFLVGHNSVGYDFAFVFARAIRHGFTSIARQLSRHIAPERKRPTKRANGAAVKYIFETREIVAMYTFCDAQYCLDTMLFLSTRMKHLPSFDLKSVLRYYNCDLVKQDLDAVEIRYFYNLLYDQSNASRFPSFDVRNVSTREGRLAYFTQYLRYNVYDCLSLCDLLQKLSFAQYATALLHSFSVPLESALYRGNSRLLPSLLVSDCYRTSNEALIGTHPNVSIYSYSSGIVQSVAQALNARPARCPRRVSIALEMFHGIDLPTNMTPIDASRHIISTRRNPFVLFVEFLRGVKWQNRLIDDTTSTTTPSVYAWSDSLSMLDETSIAEVYEEANKTFACEHQMDLLRIGEKTYVGGMNYANACHLRHPILMDYNSFYPSIIRHYELDVNNMAIFTVAKLLMIVGSPELLDQMIQSRVLRVFDYTSLDDLQHYVYADVFSDPAYAEVFTPKPFARRAWHEGIEMETLDLVLVSSRSPERRLLVLLNKVEGSTIDRVVTEALRRRAVWKKILKTNKDDKVAKSREQMDKLLANGTYGYLNYKKSVVFSRPAAASVTLLCRSTFSRTRFIIESPELMRRFGLDEKRYTASIYYIDTDGCIVALREIKPSTNYPYNRRLETDVPQRLARSCYVADNYDGDLLKHLEQLKDKFTDEVNDMLNMRHVILAAEHHEAMGASIFATKKYALFKAYSIAKIPFKTDVKKTGFESNAPVPIKALYDVVLKNLLLLNHTYNLVTADRFICKVVSHRGVIFGIFDRLYEWWREALTEKPGTPYNLRDFATRIPLNPRDTAGKLSAFIDRVIQEFNYDVGGRVRAFKLLNVDPETCLKQHHTTSGESYLVFDTTDPDFELIDVARANLDTYVPDLKYFLGGHATYIYQCIEGCQTLREKASQQKEPIEWQTKTAKLAFFHAMEKNGAYFRSRTDQPRQDDLLSPEEVNAQTLHLRSFTAIMDLYYGLWLWKRILAPKLSPEQRAKIALHWNSRSPLTYRNIGQTSLSNGDIKNAPPKLLTQAFFDRWLSADVTGDEEQVVYDALFASAPIDADDIERDRMNKLAMLQHGSILYKSLDND